jgi:hypothetical protein
MSGVRFHDYDKNIVLGSDRQQSQIALPATVKETTWRCDGQTRSASYHF